MPYCSECGKDYQDTAKFCPHCGSPNALSGSNNSGTDNAEHTHIHHKTDTPEFQTEKHSSSSSYGAYRLEDLPVGFIIDDRYEVKKKLGQGGFGAVYLAYDNKMAIEKALKIIPESVASDKEAMSDLHAEARTMVSLNHENVVRVYDVHDTGSIKYIDMEYVAGKPLNEVKLDYEGKKLPENTVKELAVKIAKGLGYAHRNKVIHKDIKPQNIMLTKDGNIKIMDFGLSETVRTSMSRVANSSSSGTLVYMSPEQVKGTDVGKESDIYSFGALLYELLSGHPPFYKGAIEYQIFNEKPGDLEGISDELNAVIQKCLEKEYQDRFREFDALIMLLKGKDRDSKDINPESKVSEEKVPNNNEYRTTRSGTSTNLINDDSLKMAVSREKSDLEKELKGSSSSFTTHQQMENSKDTIEKIDSIKNLKQRKNESHKTYKYLMKLAEKEIVSNNYSAAIIKLDEVINQQDISDNQLSAALLLRGDLKLKTKKANEAEMDFEDYFSINHAPGRHGEIAEIKEINKDYIGAIENWTMMIEMHPSYHAGFEGRAKARRLIRDMSGAKEDEKWAKMLSLDYWHSKNGDKGNEWIKWGEKAEQKFAAINNYGNGPMHCRVTSNKETELVTEVFEDAIEDAMYAFDRKNYSTAIDYLNKACELSNISRREHSNALLLRGKVKYEKGDLNSAELDFGMSISVSGDLEKFHEIAKIKESYDDYTGAIESWNQRIGITPVCIDFYRERARLKKKVGDLEGAAIDEKWARRITEPENGTREDIVKWIEAEFEAKNVWGRSENEHLAKYSKIKRQYRRD